jgi:peroxiredoxin
MAMPKSQVKRDLNKLPAGLPVPEDDGACTHLPGKQIPSLTLPSTAGRAVNLADTSKTPTIFFFYPRTGRPEAPVPSGWNQIPGARGCTPQSCGFRDHHAEFGRLGVQIFGVSSQSSDYQREFVARNRIPYEILSDEKYSLTDALMLPTFEYNSMRLIKRLALFVENSIIQMVFYPVFPPDKNADEVLGWLRRKRGSEQAEIKDVTQPAPRWSLNLATRTWHRSGYEISTDATRLDLNFVHRELSRSYWSPDVPRAVVERAIANSIVFGLYRKDGRQVGFARLVTDAATFAYLCDVVITQRERGAGLGKWLNECVISHPDLQGLRRWMLATRDAHGLYKNTGWMPVKDPAKFMERHFSNVYEAQASAQQKASYEKTGR